MDKYCYARQKFWEAMYALVGDGTIKERLGYAQSYLMQLRPEQDLPEHLRQQFHALMADLRKRTIVYGYRPARINARRPKSGNMAQTILNMYTDLRGGI